MRSKRSVLWAGSQAIAVLLMATAAASGADVESGKHLFEARCGLCHGADGAGGERGPNIVDARRGRVRSKESLREVISKGIPEGGMPAFRLPDDEMESILLFLGSLSAPAIDRALPGDVAAGSAFFFGEGKCSGCHMIQGRGGVLGPDLSNLGRERRLAQIEQALHSSRRFEPGCFRSYARQPLCSWTREERIEFRPAVTRHGWHCPPI